jgi:transcription antitermination factor NusG
MNLQPHEVESNAHQGLTPAAVNLAADCSWYAVFTIPQHEKAVVRHLALREIESFLPTYETVRVWKNRQRVRTVFPLFPSYLFVHINCRQRTRVLGSPGVIHIVGNGHEYIPVPDSAIGLLRLGVQSRNLEPFRDLVVGKKVRIRRGSMQGVQGVLVRKGNGQRFVLALDMINQYAVIEIGAEDLEPLSE